MAQPSTLAKPAAAARISRQYFSEAEVSEITGIAIATLQRWRFDGRGPKATKLGGCVKYAVRDLKAWLASCPTKGGGAAA